MGDFEVAHVVLCFPERASRQLLKSGQVGQTRVGLQKSVLEGPIET